MLDGFDAWAVSEKAVIVNKGRKRLQGRIRIAWVKEEWDNLIIVKSERADEI